MKKSDLTANVMKAFNEDRISKYEENCLVALARRIKGCSLTDDDKSEIYEYLSLAVS